MKLKIKLTGPSQKDARTAVSAGRLKACLLGFGIVVLCTAVIEHVAVKPEWSYSLQIKKISLLLTVLLLPAYFMILVIKERLNILRQRRRITRMVTQLNEHLLRDEAGSTEPCTPERVIKPSGTLDSDTLVRKIVQMINA